MRHAVLAQSSSAQGPDVLSIARSLGAWPRRRPTPLDPRRRSPRPTAQRAHAIDPLPNLPHSPLSSQHLEQEQRQEQEPHRRRPRPGLELTFRVPRDSAAAGVLLSDPLAVLTSATAEESALLAQLGSRLQAGSILAAGLVLTTTQHDTCIAKLGALQAAAVLAAANRYVAALRRLAGGGLRRGGSSKGGVSTSESDGGEGEGAGGGHPGPTPSPDGAASQARHADAAAGVWGSLTVCHSCADPRGAALGGFYECRWATGPLSGSTSPAAPQPEVAATRRPEAPNPGAKTTAGAAPVGGPATPTAAAVATGAAHGGSAGDGSNGSDGGDGGDGGAQRADRRAPSNPTALAAAVVAVAPPAGVWTSLRLDQLPRVAAHWVRQTALRRALQRLGALDGAAAPASEAPEILDHHSCCGGCRRWVRAARTALAAGAAAVLMAAAATLAALLRIGPWAVEAGGGGGGGVGRAASALLAGS